MLAAVYLLIFLSRETGDSDMWWSLAVGGTLGSTTVAPPDPFSSTTDMDTPGFAGELTTRHFNLTHE